jgi:hypothetical protein
MSRKPRVRRNREGNWRIVLEGWKNGKRTETCRKYELYEFRWNRFDVAIALRDDAMAAITTLPLPSA